MDVPHGNLSCNSPYPVRHVTASRRYASGRKRARASIGRARSGGAEKKPTIQSVLSFSRSVQYQSQYPVRRVLHLQLPTGTVCRHRGGGLGFNPWGLEFSLELLVAQTKPGGGLSLGLPVYTVYILIYTRLVWNSIVTIDGAPGSGAGVNGSMSQDTTTSASVITVSVTTQIQQQCNHQGAATVELDPAYSISSLLHTARDALGVIDRPVHELAFIAAAHNQFLTAEDWLEGIPAWLTDGTLLELVLSPTVEVREVLDQLSADHTDDPEAREQKKRRVYWLRSRLLIWLWAEEFMAQDGLSVLFGLLESTASASSSSEVSTTARRSLNGGARVSIFTREGNAALQGYCLMALRQALCWQCGMTELCSSPGHVYLLFSLLYTGKLRVASTALELLFVCCSANLDSQPDPSGTESDSTFSTMLAAASAAGHANGEEPFAILVTHASCDDIEVKLNAITLMNCLISAATVAHSARPPASS